MACQQVDVILCVAMHAAAFRNDIADKLVILLEPPLLIGDVRVTVINKGARPSVSRLFNVPGVLKFRPVVGEYHREVPAEKTDTKGVSQGVDRIDDLSLRAASEEDNDHKRTAAEEECQETFTGRTAALDCIHLNDIRAGVSFEIAFEILESAPVPVDLKLFTRVGPVAVSPFLIPDTSGEIDVSGLKDSLVEVVIESSPGDRNLIGVDRKDM